MADDADTHVMDEGAGGSARSVGVASALLNLTGFGLGYAYLRSYLRWALYLAGAIALLIAIYFIEDDTVSPFWGLLLLAWIALSTWDGWRKGLTEASHVIATGWTPIVIALVLITALLAAFWGFRSSAASALAAGRDAQEEGDCSTAQEHFETVGSLHKLTFTSAVGSARTNGEECKQFLAAQEAREKGAYPATVEGYREFMRVNPDSVLVPHAREDLAQTQREWKRAYQRQLTLATRRIRASIGELRRLGAVPKLSTWFDDAEKDFSKADSLLGEVAPPEPVADIHLKLSSAIVGIATSLTRRDLETRDRLICAAPSALPQLAIDGIGPDLRAAEKVLKRKGFRLDLSVIWRAKQPNRRLPTGRFLVDGLRGGANTVTIENRGGLDGIVAFAQGSQRPLMSVYVRKKSEFTISGMVDGSYDVYFTLGQDWDARYRTFTRFCSFLKSDNKANLTSSATQYTIGTLTFGLPAGSKQGSRSTVIDPEDFPGGPGNSTGVVAAG